VFLFFFSITLKSRIQKYTALTRSTINHNLKFTNGTDALVCKRIIQKNRMALPSAFIRNQPACRHVGWVIQPNRNATTQIAHLSMLKCSIKVPKRQHKEVILWKKLPRFASVYLGNWWIFNFYLLHQNINILQISFSCKSHFLANFWVTTSLDVI